jgi:hypothetical protein
MPKEAAAGVAAAPVSVAVAAIAAAAWAAADSQVAALGELAVPA